MASSTMPQILDYWLEPKAKQRKLKIKLATTIASFLLYLIVMDNENKNLVDYVKEALGSKPKMSDLTDRIIDMNETEYWDLVRKMAEDMKLKYKQWQIENKKKEIEKDFE